MDWPRTTRRRLLNAVVLMAMLTLALYAASFRWAFSFHHPQGTVVILATRGLVHVQHYSVAAVNPPAPVDNVWRVSRTAGRVLWLPRYSNIGGWKIVSLPLWLPMGCIAAGLVVRAVERRRRRRSGECADCRYDLAGLCADEHERVTCPECGARTLLRRGGRGVKNKDLWRSGRDDAHAGVSAAHSRSAAW